MRLFWGNKFGYLAISLYLCIVKIDGDIETNKTFYNNTKTKLNNYGIKS